MGLYGQEAEVDLLSTILPSLEHRSVVDVGAERGGFVSAMLDAGAEAVYAAEPEPQNVDALSERFRGEPRVRIHPYAISSGDGEVTLHISTDPSGGPLSFGHTLLDRPGAEDIVWEDTVAVPARSLGSLVASGEIPSRVGVLKVDTEGHDLAVLAGMGDLDCDVIVTEQWLELPRSLGPCPWTVEEMLTTLQPRGFGHFALFVHMGEYTILQWDDGDVPMGMFGNAVFLHDRVLTDVLPDVLASCSVLARSGAEIAEQRLATIDLIARERDIQAAAALERLRALEAWDASRGSEGQ